jgi:hypothetical protein
MYLVHTVPIAFSEDIRPHNSRLVSTHDVSAGLGSAWLDSAWLDSAWLALARLD